MAGQICRDFLISTRSKKLPIHENIKRNGSHIAHEYIMKIQAMDTISFSPFNGGTRPEWTCAINTNRDISPISVQLYTQHASGLVDTRLGDAHLRKFETRGVKFWIKSCEIQSWTSADCHIPIRPALVTTTRNDERAANTYVYPYSCWPDRN
jgi:hypothetical protein